MGTIRRCEIHDHGGFCFASAVEQSNILFFARPSRGDGLTTSMPPMPKTIIPIAKSKNANKISGLMRLLLLFGFMRGMYFSGGSLVRPGALKTRQPSNRFAHPTQESRQRHLSAASATRSRQAPSPIRLRQRIRAAEPAGQGPHNQNLREAIAVRVSSNTSGFIHPRGFEAHTCI